MNARPISALDFYATFGTADATFGAGSTSNGVDVSGNDLPLAPGYTASLGAKLSAGIGRSLGVYGRADVVFYGAYHYDDQNRAGQDAYQTVDGKGVPFAGGGVTAGLRDLGRTVLRQLQRGEGSGPVHPGRHIHTGVPGQARGAHRRLPQAADEDQGGEAGAADGQVRGNRGR